MLENEAIRRAYQGVEKPITVAGKREIIHESRFSSYGFLFVSNGSGGQVVDD
jgi:hypothetical protein